MDVVDRFCLYAQFNTQSNESSKTSPSTKGQLIFAQHLCNELRELGLDNAFVDQYGYVYAKLPANTTKKFPKIGFVAHLDTSPDECGKNVKPQIIKSKSGEHIITSDGSTLLGADDKAGIAEIMSTLEFFSKYPNLEHGDVFIAFTPDEEIGRGTDHFNLDVFQADFAYTVDGGEEGELEIENFNAAKATLTIFGKNYHPGYAKNKMRNAAIIASKVVDIISMEPLPESTEGREGFFHVIDVTGDVSKATVKCLIRDFDDLEFENKKKFLQNIVKSLNDQFGKGTAKLKIEEQYRNMFEIISNYPEIVHLAKLAMKNVGIAPKLTPIRGGTDGVKLSFMGLPCPNLFTGGLNFHSKKEYIPVQSLEYARFTITEIIRRAYIAKK